MSFTRVFKPLGSWFEIFLCDVFLQHTIMSQMMHGSFDHAYTFCPTCGRAWL